MEEKWKKWIPIEGVSKDLNLSSITFDNNGLLIKLCGQLDKEELEVSYESVFSFRSTDEGRRLNLLNTLSEKYGKDFYKTWSMFKVEFSPYINWLNKETYGIYESYDIEHHVYITSNDILEVITAQTPSFKIRREI